MTVRQLAAADNSRTRGAPQDRIYWLDYAKALSIILVCFGHTIGGLRPDVVGSDIEFYNSVNALSRSFRMPLFFFVSGVLIGHRPSSLSQFVRSATVGVVAPYLIWSFIFVLLQNLFSIATNSATPLSGLTTVLWSPIGHFWFFYAVLAARAVYSVAMGLFGKNGVLGAFAISALLYVLVPPSYDPIAILMGCTYCGMGMIASSALSSPESHRVTALALCFAALFWVVSVEKFDPETPRQLVAVGVAVAGIAMTVAFCQLLPVPHGSLLRGLAQIGQGSIAIYVAHVIFAAFVRYVLYSVGFFHAGAHVLLGTVAGVLAPATLFVLANRMRVAPFVGFGKTQRRLYVAVLDSRAAG
jgi:fucose 4-O-acetylase-like acetyltransferase